MSRFSFRQVGEARKYRSWKKWGEGDYMICKLVKDFKDQHDNTAYEVEVIETDFAVSEDNIKEGVIFGMNGCANLDRKIKDVNDGAIIRVEYKGMNEVEKGPRAGKMAHAIGLQVDEGTLDVAAIKKVQDKVQEEAEDYDLD